MMMAEPNDEQQSCDITGKSSNSSNETVINANLQSDISDLMIGSVSSKEDQEEIYKSSEQNNSRQSKFKSLLLFTAQLNPFGQFGSRKSSTISCAGEQQDERANQGSSRQRGHLALIEFAQRYFGGRKCEHAEQQFSCRSAPVTPLKSSSISADHCGAQQANNSVHSNGIHFGISGGEEELRLAAVARPQVRFAPENAKHPKGKQKAQKGGASKKLVCERASQTCPAPPTTPTSLGEPEKPEELVGRLFPAPGDEGAAAGECPMDSERFKKHGYSLIDYISNYLDTIHKRRVTPLNIEPGYLKSLIKLDAPLKGEPFSSIMKDFERHIMQGITHWQHPHFHAYFPAGNAYPSILADMLSDALGCVGFSWAASPAYTELEIIMLDWMGKMIGLPEEFLCLSGGKNSESKGGGVIQGSASECVLVNLLAARHSAMEKLRLKYPGEPDGLLLTKLIGYCSKEAHSCVEKAAMIGFIRMRALDTDERNSLRGETLAKAMQMDEANGLEPFLVCATLGTTSCVSFDNLEELGAVCKQRDVWLHVDAAYAGSALICPEFKYLIKGIEMVTSFNMNPNKWMLINFDCSLMWVKDRFKLTRAFVVDPLYLQHSFSDQAIDYRHWGIPLSRRFRALKLWFVIRNYGIEGLQAYIRNHVRLAKLFEQLIRQDARFTITNEVVLGLVCFRLLGSNALNQRLLSIINGSGKLHMVPASVNGRFVIRFCVCEQNAQESDIRYAYECISAFADELFESIRLGKERIRALSQQNTIDASSVSISSAQHSISSCERLNKLPAAGAKSQSEQQAQEQHLHQQLQVSHSASPAGSPREAARRYMLERRHSRHAHATDLVSGQQHEQQAGAGSGNPTAPAADNDDDEDLEQEIVLDSLASIEGFEDEDEDCYYEDEDEDDYELPAPAAHDEAGELFGRARSRNKQAGEPEDEVLQHLAQQRNRMSLRYKREFFVRVVSDPRVYRASISGDINAHASCGSLGGVAQNPTKAGAVGQQTTTTTTTSAQANQSLAANREQH